MMSPFFCAFPVDTDEVGAVGVDDGDGLSLNADDILSMRVRNTDILCPGMSREGDVIQLPSVLRDDSMPYRAVCACEKKYGGDPAEDEQRADEQKVVFLHWNSLPRRMFSIKVQ